MNTHRDTGTPTGSLSIGLILTGEYRHRRTGTQENTALPLATTDTGDRLAPVARPCWLSPPRSMMMHHKGNEHSQAYSLTGSYHCRHRRTGTQEGDRLALPRSYPYRRIPTQENRTQENTALPLATTDTGDRLAPVARSCWLSLSRSMMMNTAKEMNAHRDTGTPTGLHPYRLLPLPTREDRTQEGDRLALLQGLTKKLF